LYLYLVAGGALFCSICGFFSHRDKPTAVHHSKITSAVDSISLRT
jgi:hypothetical protein